ncbi:hypothetical protein ACI3EY_07950 [Ornithinimicrobium sp. LYQ92]|uniref:hypothetical protein n=1 Tax=Serinicoccus sp. LYQ92 TaxID=3378798 RepID=UPI0038528AF3
MSTPDEPKPKRKPTIDPLPAREVGTSASEQPFALSLVWGIILCAAGWVIYILALGSLDPGPWPVIALLTSIIGIVAVGVGAHRLLAALEVHMANARSRHGAQQDRQS